MAITLTTPYSFPNCTRWLVTGFTTDENAQVAQVVVRFASASGTNLTAQNVKLVIRNGLCDRVVRNSAPAANGLLGDVALQASALNLASGYTNAINAWRVGGATPALRAAALEAHLLSVGIIDATLTGT